MSPRRIRRSSARYLPKRPARRRSCAGRRRQRHDLQLHVDAGLFPVVQVVVALRAARIRRSIPCIGLDPAGILDRVGWSRARLDEFFANATPILADEMTTLVFSPYWNIPPDIVEKEILPKLDTDPMFLERNNMEVDETGQRYHQRPGRGNSLGQVKFVFPNHYNVYLHGTPSQKLFDRVERVLRKYGFPPARSS